MSVPAPQGRGPSAGNPRFEASYQRLFGGRIAVDDADPFFETFYRRFLADPEVKLYGHLRAEGAG